MAGAGPAGLSAALLLGRDGHRVRLFERFAKPHPVGSGLMLQPTGLAVLDELGLRGRMAALGAPIERLIGTDSKSGRVVLDVGYKPLGWGIRALAVHRAALFHVLYDAVLAAQLPVRADYAVTDIERDRGKIWLRAPAGLEGPFDLVVDALGSASPLRKPGGRLLEFGAIWGTVPWRDEGFERQALMQRYRAARVMIGMLPLGRQRLDGPELGAFFWSLKWADYEALKARGFAAWRDEVVRHWPDMAAHVAGLGSFEALTLARYVHHTLPVPAGEAIAFIGDSAHATSPQLGQGVNMALLDAAALAQALRGGDDLPEALERYAALRRWHVRLYQFLSLTLTPFYQSEGRLLPVLRDWAVASVGRLPVVSGILAQMVSGQLTNPLKPLGLKARPLREGGT